MNYWKAINRMRMIALSTFLLFGYAFMSSFWSLDFYFDSDLCTWEHVLLAKHWSICYILMLPGSQEWDRAGAWPHWDAGTRDGKATYTLSQGAPCVLRLQAARLVPDPLAFFLFPWNSLHTNVHSAYSASKSKVRCPKSALPFLSSNGRLPATKKMSST